MPLLSLPDALLAELLLSAETFQLTMYAAASATCRRIQVALQVAGPMWQALALARFPRLQQLITFGGLVQPDFRLLFKTQHVAEVAARKPHYGNWPALVTKNLNDFVFTFELCEENYSSAFDNKVFASWTGRLDETSLAEGVGICLWDAQSVPTELPDIPQPVPVDTSDTAWEHIYIRVIVSRVIMSGLQSLVLLDGRDIHGNAMGSIGGGFESEQAVYWDRDTLPLVHSALVNGWLTEMVSPDQGSWRTPGFKPTLYRSTGRLCDLFHWCDEGGLLSDRQLLFYLEHCAPWTSV